MPPLCVCENFNLHSSLQVNLTNMYKEIDLSTYHPHEGWELIIVPVKRNVLKYDCCPESYIDIQFTIKNKEKRIKLHVSWSSDESRIFGRNCFRLQDEKEIGCQNGVQTYLV